jgi:hypothetical protein
MLRQLGRHFLSVKQLSMAPLALNNSGVQLLSEIIERGT